MPIYSYRCDTCGHQQDILQKMSDSLLTVCTACGASTFRKQVTAAGFQLKGSGWYVTDFRDGKGAPKPEGTSTAAASDAPAPSAPAPSDSPAAKPAASTPAKSETTPAKPSPPPASGTS